MKRSATVTVVSPYHHKRQKVGTGKRHPQTGQEVMIVAEQAIAVNTRPSWAQTIATPAVSEQALGQTSYFSFILENNSRGVIDDATLRFTVDFATNGAGAVPTDSRVMPVTQWFERIEFYDRLTGTEICRYPGDILHLLLNTMHPAVLSAWAEMVNFCPKTGRVSGREWREGDTQYFYLPISAISFLRGLELDLSTLRGDLEIRFYPRGRIFVSAQAGLTQPTTASLKEIRLIQSNTQLPNGMRLGRHADMRSKILEHRFLDYHQFTDYGRVITAGDEFTVDLDHFSHVSGALLVYLRKSGAQGVAGGEGSGVVYDPSQGERLFSCEALGDSATIDMENLHGKSLLGEGTAIDEKFFRDATLGELTNTNFAATNNVYVIPFSHDLHHMVRKAEMDGFRKLKGDKERLRFKTAAAPRETTAVFTLPSAATLVNTNRFTVAWDGVTVAVLDVDSDTGVFTRVSKTYGTSPDATCFTNLNTILADSTYLQKHNVKLFFSGHTSTPALDGVNINVEYLDVAGQPKIWDTSDFGRLSVRVDDLVANTTKECAVTATTPGRRGFRTGVYDILVYSVYYKSLREVAGRLEIEAV